MACDFPLTAYRTPHGSDSALTFSPLKALNSTHPILLPCQRCVGCRIAKAESWAIRSVHEAKMHKQNSFITLTYSNEHLPDDYSVSKRTWQLFMKRLRKQHGAGVRFYACGEYGDLHYRPHYHALLFGLDWSDKKLWKTINGERLYTSEKLSSLWPYGQASTGDVTFKSAGYCTRYVMKKMTGDKADDHYWRLNPINGQMVRQETEFALQSRMPGLGDTWFQKFKSDVFPSDHVIIDGKEKPVPAYYLRKLAEEEQERVKRSRKPQSAYVVKGDRYDTEKRRLNARRVIRDQRIQQLKRPLKDH